MDAATNYDAEQLFRKHSIAELATLEAKIRYALPYQVFNVQPDRLSRPLLAKPMLSIYGRADIERKKQELRLMVGERYRDLIDAADSIQSMRKSATAVQEMFDKMQQSCDIQSLKRNIQQKAYQNRDQAAEDKKRLLYPIAAQIKLLVDTPEQIWHAMENHHYLRASRLYLIAKLVHKNLQSTKEAASLKLSRQWDAVSHFRGQILQKSTAHLKVVGRSDQLTETLCAIMLLDNSTPRAALDKFLGTRKVAIVEYLANFEKTTTILSEHLRQVVKLVDATLRQVAQVFIQPQSPQQAHRSPLPGAHSASNSNDERGEPMSLFETYIHSLRKREPLDPSRSGRNGIIGDGSTGGGSSTNLITGLYSETANVHIVFRHLPSSVQNYTPFLNVGIGSATGRDLTQAVVREAVTAWLKEVAEELRKGGYGALKTVDAGATLAAVQKSVLEAIYERVAGTTTTELRNSGSTKPHVSLEKVSIIGTAPGSLQVKRPTHGQQPWNELCTSLVGRPFSIWDEIFRPVFNRRAEEIVRQRFKTLAEKPYALVREHAKKINEEVNNIDRHVGEYVWDYENVDSPALNSNATNPNGSRSSITTNPSSTSTCRTQTPASLDIAECFKWTLESIREDLNPLLCIRLNVSSSNSSTGKLGVDDLSQRLQRGRIGSVGTGYWGEPLDQKSLASASRKSSSESVDGEDVFDLRGDEAKLRQTCREACSAAIKQFVESLNGHFAPRKDEDDTDSEDFRLFIGRAARAVALKIRQMEEVLRFDDDSSASSGADGSAVGGVGAGTPISSVPQRFKSRFSVGSRPSVSDSRRKDQEKLMMDVYAAAHASWIKSLAARFAGTLSRCLSEEDWDAALKLRGVWESISIQASSTTDVLGPHIHDGMTSSSSKEQNQPMQIGLPVQASPFLVNALTDVVGDLNRVAAYSMEKPILESLLASLASAALAVYTDFCNKFLPNPHEQERTHSTASSMIVSEKGAMQLLFDVRFLAKVFDERWKHEDVDGVDGKAAAVVVRDLLGKIRMKLQFFFHCHLTTQQSVTSVYEIGNSQTTCKQIDPIDLAVIEGQLEVNVDRFYYRTSVLLGSALLLNPRPVETKKNPSLHELHNVVAVATQTPRFTMLPITASSISSIASKGGLQAKRLGKENLAENQSKFLSSSDIRQQPPRPSASTGPTSSAGTSSASKLRKKSLSKMKLFKTSKDAPNNTGGSSYATGASGLGIGGMAAASSISASVGNVFGLVGAAAVGAGKELGISFGQNQSVKASDLLMTASSILSGVWGVGSSGGTGAGGGGSAGMGVGSSTSSAIGSPRLG
ncbi:Golgi transport complex subunit 1 [Quaeritorhiza haematococci]|nr:Golgi transport complex subunit 1 [Quaeritorhiza haematococci]